MNDLDSVPHPKIPVFWRSRYAVGLLVMGAIATYYLAGEHRAHFIGALPLVLLLTCLLMHVFMHNGHGFHSSRHAGRHEAKTLPPGPALATSESNHDP